MGSALILKDRSLAIVPKDKLEIPRRTNAKIEMSVKRKGYVPTADVLTLMAAIIVFVIPVSYRVKIADIVLVIGSSIFLKFNFSTKFNSHRHFII